MATPVERKSYVLACASALEAAKAAADARTYSAAAEDLEPVDPDKAQILRECAALSLGSAEIAWRAAFALVAPAPRVRLFV